MYVDRKVTGKQQAEGKRIKTSVCTWATIKEAQSQGQNSLDNLYIPRTSLAICFSSMMIVAPCFDVKRCACPQPFACMIPLVDIHAKRLPLMPTHHSLAT